MTASADSANLRPHDYLDHILEASARIQTVERDVPELEAQVLQLRNTAG
ncbi:MAG: hypothetical protein IPJ52_07435 [Rhodocyclaceae bacterium]|nr:hypothetical protein [Rhodocyclaceae bacterium]